jgi:hypothetical protein
MKTGCSLYQLRHFQAPSDWDGPTTLPSQIYTKLCSVNCVFRRYSFDTSFAMLKRSFKFLLLVIQITPPMMSPPYRGGGVWVLLRPWELRRW